MTDKKNFENSPEADYFRSLPWKWCSYEWKICKVPEYTKSKLKQVFDSWDVGWHADVKDCKGGQYNISITDRQLKRAGIIFGSPEERNIINESIHKPKKFH